MAVFIKVTIDIIVKEEMIETSIFTGAVVPAAKEGEGVVAAIGLGTSIIAMHVTNGSITILMLPTTKKRIPRRRRRIGQKEGIVSVRAIVLQHEGGRVIANNPTTPLRHRTTIQLDTFMASLER
jgi:hypothetical protein